jgi:2-dehydro-3-deoxy-D-arabinonate dehydratase
VFHLCDKFYKLPKIQSQKFLSKKMKIYKTKQGNIIEHQNAYYISKVTDWDVLVNQDHLFTTLKSEIATLSADASLEALAQNDCLAPIGNQEIWASGVTYLRSKKARMEESKDSGGGDFYDRVYDAARPEIFFKATVARTVGPNQNIRIRKDSKWNVPEPELTLFVNNQSQIAGYTVGNDVSSRDIEGENPLYLPQAKSYDKSAAIGPCILVLEEPISKDTTIDLKISRNGEVVFSGSTQLTQIKRDLNELVEYLTRESSFPVGCFLMTGTGIIPEDSFSMIVGDVTSITIAGIGTLTNTVETK